MTKLSTALACLLLAGSACKKDKAEDKNTPAPEEKTVDKTDSPTPDSTKTPDKDPEPAKLSAADQIAAVNGAWKASGESDTEAYKAFFAQDVVVENVDSGMPASEGVEAVMAQNAMWHTAFPDMKSTIVKQFADGERVVSIAHMGGTHKGELMGMPATGKSVGLLMAEVSEFNAEGKIAKQWYLSDFGTLMGQIGMHEMPHRAAAPAGEVSEAIVAAKDEKEKANLALSEAIVAASNSGDTEAYFGNFAEDYAIHDQMMPADMQGLKAFRAMWDSWSKGFSDMKMAPAWLMTAGDYAIWMGSWSAKNTGALPEMGIKEASGKTISMSGLGINRIADGKVAESWMFGNGMAMAKQLGLVPEPGKGDAPAGK